MDFGATPRKIKEHMGFMYFQLKEKQNEIEEIKKNQQYRKSL